MRFIQQQSQLDIQGGENTSNRRKQYCSEGSNSSQPQEVAENSMLINSKQAIELAKMVDI